VTDTRIAHISDLHFGGRADVRQLEVLERFLPTTEPDAIVVSGDLSLRARHGEFQAAKLMLDRLGAVAPVHLVPGNHDVQWWRSPLGLFGRRVMYGKWRRYFGEDLTPVLELDQVIIAGLLSANGLAWGSLTWNPNDCTVKGNLPRSEVARVKRIFAQAAPHKARLAVLHHNVVPGVVSRRWGLAWPRRAQRALLSLGADLVLCGHDHTEGSGQIGGTLAVSTAGTHCLRTRGGRCSAFNLVTIAPDRIAIQHLLYDQAGATFRPGDTAMYARTRESAAQPVR
jgi:3',5'-cyclic AMP phosphodiesterase CpdA